MDALSEINENGEVVPNEAKALAASKDAAAAALGRRLCGYSNFSVISGSDTGVTLPSVEKSGGRSTRLPYFAICAKKCQHMTGRKYGKIPQICQNRSDTKIKIRQGRNEDDK